jgi:FlaA1/EpsC-like NDP-sugar epimerase
MTRFVMTLGDAVRLVLDAVTITRGGETFILKMQSVRVTDVAEVMIRELAGGKGVPIVVTGMKPGEKLHEELLVTEELPRALEFPDMYLLLPNMPEVLQVDPKDYSEAKPPGQVPYTSDRVDKLGQKEITRLLRQEQLL